MVTPIQTRQQQDKFETLIQSQVEKGFGCIDDFLDAKTISGLRSNLLKYRKSGEMQPAGIGRMFDYQKNTMVRGDVIKWIEQKTANPTERDFIEMIEEFIRYLNQTCYTSINDFEFHYAYYEKNTFYKRHLDQFKSQRGRKYSLVIYLNKDWKITNGGKLSLFLDKDQREEILPLGGRTVFFKSDEMEHEVSPSLHRGRLSIAGWLKSV